MKDYINGEFPGDGLGDLLFGSYDDFKARVNMLDDESQQKYTDLLQQMEIVQIEADEWAKMDRISFHNEITHKSWSSTHVYSVYFGNSLS